MKGEPHPDILSLTRPSTYQTYNSQNLILLLKTIKDLKELLFSTTIAIIFIVLQSKTIWIIYDFLLK